MYNVIKKYINIAKSVLEANRIRTGGFTMPSSSLYPHQWNWDSGFIAIGYSRYDAGLAAGELKPLFSAQWSNGMLPHIVFNQRRLGSYFPEPDFWQTDLSPDSPGDHMTSGITMPPIHAYSVLKVYENTDDRGRVMSFLGWIYPRLLNLHRYLYSERDPEGSGLVYIIHPWESGMDNSPSWDAPLKEIDLRDVKLPAYRRKDLEAVGPEMRPTGEYYDYFVYLVDLFRRLRYNGALIRKECPFLVLDPLFNSILCASNLALVELAGILGKDGREPREWYETTSKAISERLFHGERRLFDAIDLVGKRHLEIDTASGFMPLFAGAASDEQARRIYEYLDSGSFCALHQGNCFTVPSYDTRKEGFVRENYWRGPVWLNINWMLYQGLLRYGYRQKADSLARDILELPIRSGFYEYFDSMDGRGYGTGNFSWTAALFIDTAYEKYVKTGEVSLSKRLANVLWKGVVLNSMEGKREVPPGVLSQEMLSAVSDIKRKYYSSEGTVDYEAIKDSEEYGRYREIAAKLRDFDLAHLESEEERTAFWINLYNTIVVDGIIALGLKSSVKECIGFFSRIKYIVSGYGFSPDDIEHGILRANERPPRWLFRQFGPFDPRRKFSLRGLDPRIHLALVCGSRSCAPIKFYTSQKIHEELEAATSNFINSSEVIVVPEEDKALVSSIFRWYEGDFGGREGVVDFLARYVVDDVKREFLRARRPDLKIGYLYYDWNLNQ